MNPRSNIRQLEADLNNTYDIVDMLRGELQSCNPVDVECMLYICESIWDALDVADSIEDLYKEALRNER